MKIDTNGLSSDYLLNLTGAGIADKRWTTSRKKVLIDSRVNSNKLLLKGLKQKGITVTSFTCASAIGFYGDRADELLDESSQPGEGFLAKCCELWEQSADLLTAFSDKTSKVRIGLVLSSMDGALPKMLMTNKVGVLSYFGSGKQYYPWIHIDDLCRIIVESLTNESFAGVINGVNPEPITNQELMIQIKNELDLKSVILPAPAFGLRIALGEMADVVLNSNRVIPKFLLDNNFEFKFNHVGKAVKDLLERNI